MVELRTQYSPKFAALYQQRSDIKLKLMEGVAPQLAAGREGAGPEDTLGSQFTGLLISSHKVRDSEPGSEVLRP